VHREGGVVGLDDSIRDLGGGDDRVGGHDTVGVLLTDLGDQKSSHTGSSSSSHGVGELESLHAVAGLGLLTDNIKDGVNELSSLGVVSLGPVVTGSGLSEDKVIGAEKLSEGSGTDGVHGSGLEVHEDGTGDIASTGGLVEVHVDALQLKVTVSVVGSGGVNSVLVGHDLPELGTNLVTALSSLNVNDFSHVDKVGEKRKRISVDAGVRGGGIQELVTDGNSTRVVLGTVQAQDEITHPGGVRLGIMRRWKSFQELWKSGSSQTQIWISAVLNGQFFRVTLTTPEQSNKPYTTRGREFGG